MSVWPCSGSGKGVLLGLVGGAKSGILEPCGRGGLLAPGETGLEAVVMMEASSSRAALST